MVARSAGVLTATLVDDSAARAKFAEPRTVTEKTFAEVLANILHVDRVPVDSHFFDDLGADSLMMAQFCARVRKRPDLPSVSMKDVYQLGDHAVLNAGSKVQCHSQEDGAFKSDHTIIGDDCTLGVGAFVHYGVTLGDGAVLDPDSFLMKGERVPPAARWGGNPATAVAAQQVIGANDPLPALPVIRPGGRHRSDDGESPHRHRPRPHPRTRPRHQHQHRHPSTNCSTHVPNSVGGTAYQ